MTDITKCTNDKCTIKKYCYRFNAPADERQSYSKWNQDDNEECDGYWEKSEIKQKEKR